MRHFILVVILYLINFSGIKAQQSPLYSQYILNEFIVNPSLAGNDGTTTINMSGRKQWWGLGNSPETYSASVSTRILKSRSPIVSKKKPGASSIRKGSRGRVGLGGSILMDRNGAVNSTTFNFSYAYHISFYASDLSFGGSLLTTQFSIDEDLAEFRDPDDPAAALLGVSTYTPDAAFGVDYSAEKYHVGLSIFNLFQSPVKFGAARLSSDQLDRERVYYLIGTYRDEFESNSDFEYEGATIIRATEKFLGSAELTARFIYQGEYWAGLSYRTSKEIVALLGLKLNRVYFGYSFDYGFSDLAKVTYGSHEVVLALKLGDSSKRYRYWIRY